MRSALAFSPARLSALAGLDLRSVAREPMLASVVVMAVAPCLVFHVAGEPIDRFVERNTGLADFTEHALAFVLVLPGLLLGWVSGMLVVEDRDEGALTGMDVTPLGRSGIMLYRAALSAALSAVVAVIAVRLLVGASPQIAVLPVFLALQSATVTLALPKLAGNRVEGLALSKFMSPLAALSLLPLLASNLAMAGAIFPPYWIGVMAEAPTSAIPISSLVWGGFVHGVWLAVTALAPVRSNAY